MTTPNMPQNPVWPPPDMVLLAALFIYTKESSMIEDIRRAITAEKRRLHRMNTLTSLSPARAKGVRMFKEPQVSAMLRVEVERRHEETLWDDSRRDDELLEQFRSVGRGERDGPFTVMGVALYFVDKLPAPGWRVINPMAATA